jgi:hypothetical protein
MSAASLSAAKKRRAAGANNNDNMPVPPRDFNSTKTNGLTMQQVISAFNTRITKLEKNIDDKPINNNDNMQVSSEEIDTRFQILVNEIQELKDMVLKVQSFTMEVNKTLFNERIKLLSTESLKISNDVIESIDGDLNKMNADLINKETDNLNDTTIEDGEEEEEEEDAN